MKIAEEYVLLCERAQKLKYHPKLTTAAAILYDLILMDAVRLDNSGMLHVNPDFNESKLEAHEKTLFQEIKKHSSKKLWAMIMKHYAFLDSNRFHKAVLQKCEQEKRNTEKQISAVVEELRADLLEEGRVTEESAVLTLLLKQAKILKYYFSDYECKTLSKRLKEIPVDTAHYNFFRTLRNTIKFSDILTWS